jgi:hypothetical protein
MRGVEAAQEDSGLRGLYSHFGGVWSEGAGV